MPSNIKWTNEKALNVLANKVANAMMQGKMSPVAERALERLARAAKIEAMIAESLSA